MFKSILVAYDGSEPARAALEAGIQLAKRTRSTIASVSVEEVLPRYADTIDEVEEAKDDIEEHSRRMTTETQDRAWADGIHLETVVRQGHEVETILAEVRQRRADLLVIGFQGHSRVFERFLGSTAMSLARLAPCSVLVVTVPKGPGHAQGWSRILVGLDGSPYGRLAMQMALEMASLSNGAVVGLTVFERSPLGRAEPPDQGYAQQVQTAAAEHARTAGVPFEGVTRQGHATEILCQEAQATHADLLVLGATGLGRPWSPVIGGTTTGVASQAPCSVLLVRPPQAAWRIQDVMVRAVSTVFLDSPLLEVVELLQRRNVKALPVLDHDRHVVGMITGGDLLTRSELGVRLSIQRELSAESLREQLRELARGQKTAREVMTRHVHTIAPEADLPTAIRLMGSHRVKRLPVVDPGGALVGIISRADVLRALAALPESTIAPALQARVSGTVGDAITTGIPTVSPQTSAEEVLVKLLECPLRRVVVVGEAGRVLGLISDRDVLLRAGPDVRPWVLRVLTARHPWRRPGDIGKPPAGPHEPLTAEDLMAPALFAVHPEDSLAQAIRLMIQHQVKRLVVTDAEGRFLGLVDRRALLQSLVG